MVFFLVLVSSFLLILFSSYAFQIFADARRRLPPGPMPLPVIGNLLDAASCLPHRSLARLAERYGPLMTVRLGSAMVIVASSPSAAREVLKTHNASITGRDAPDAWNGMGHAANSVFILPPRHRWRALRRIGTQHLVSPRKLDGLRPVMWGAVDSMLRHVAEMAAVSDGAPVEVGRVVFAAMADLQWRAMFSSGLDAATTRELHAVAREAAKLALKPNVSDFFPALAPLDLQGVRRSMTRQLGKVYKLIDQEIDQRRRGREAGSVDEREKDDLLDVMLEMSEVDGAVMNRDSMRAFLTDLFLAGIDTVSGTIQWAMAELLQNPQTVKKLKEELSKVLASKEHVEYSDDLPYLQAVIKETLRLHPVVPLAPNKAEETVEIHGYTIPKGSTVIVNLWAIHHSAQVWIEPDKFIPERFLCKEVHFQGMDFEFMPFSTGRRICLGLPLAKRMLPAFLGSLMHRFEWTLPGEAMQNGVDMSEILGLTMSMATPLQAIVVNTM